MKKFIKLTIVCGLLVTTMLTSNIITYANEKSVNMLDESEQIKDEIIIKVTKDFDGKINNELEKLGVKSIEKIFEVDDTVMYVVKTKGVIENIIEKLEKLTYVEYAEYSQIASTSDDVNMLDESEQIKDEIIIKVTKDFDGKINNELEKLGVISIEKIFDTDDTVMYVVKTKGVIENIIEKLEKLTYVEYAEYSQVVSASDDVNMLDENKQIKDEVNIDKAEPSKSPMNYILIGGGIVVVILGVALYLNKRK